MNILNKKELRRQIRSGEFTSLDNILNEFKDIIREVVQTSTTAELDEHLGYDKHSSSNSGNYRNGHNTKPLKQPMVILMLQCQEIEMDYLSQN